MSLLLALLRRLLFDATSEHIHGLARRSRSWIGLGASGQYRIAVSRAIVAMLACAFANLPASSALGGVDFTLHPYHGIADSPFVQGGLGGSFDDFEDGELNLPGVCLKDRPIPLQPKVFPAAVPTRSIESPGHSFGPTFEFVTASSPPRHQSSIDLSFNESMPSAWRHETGFALTSAPAFGLLSVTVFGSGGEVLGEFQRAFDDLAISTFVAIVSELPIKELQIRATVTDGQSFFHIDHLQYAVPEPESFMLAALAFVVSVLVVHGKVRRGE